MEEFFTMKGYRQRGAGELTDAMEDYLEMISRMEREGGRVRVRALAEGLNVRPSSVSKMLGHLQESGYLSTEPYGEIRLTEKGRQEGEYLLYRHGVILRFLCALNGSSSELEQTELIEHFLNPQTVWNLEILTRKMTGEEKSAPENST